MTRILGWLAVKFRQKLYYKISKPLARFIYRFHKGECDYDKCGAECCRWELGCKHLIENKCTIYDRRNRCCEVAPFPMDLWWNSKFKNCTVYYLSKETKHWLFVLFVIICLAGFWTYFFMINNWCFWGWHYC